MSVMRALPGPLADRSPVTVAPMAGGPSTPTLVAAAARGGALAQLAAGYRTAPAVAAEIAAVRALGTEVFGVNLFVPNPSPIAPEAYDRYARTLRGVADRLGVGELPGQREDDDAWDDKVALLLDDPVPLVTFTFGLPEGRLVARFRAAGSVTAQTVTSPAEALAAAERGVDVLVVQGHGAGGHSGVLDPRALPADLSLPELVRSVRSVTALPVVAAGGIGTAADVAVVLAAGSSAVAVGTAVLRAPESGASAVHKHALADPAYTRTTLTRAFTGRAARALHTAFVAEHEDAPIGYPALHHLTKPIRAASTAAGDAGAVNLWAGTSWRAATERPVAETLARLVP